MALALCQHSRLYSWQNFEKPHSRSVVWVEAGVLDPWLPNCMHAAATLYGCHFKLAGGTRQVGIQSWGVYSSGGSLGCEVGEIHSSLCGLTCTVGVLTLYFLSHGTRCRYGVLTFLGCHACCLMPCATVTWTGSHRSRAPSLPVG